MTSTVCRAQYRLVRFAAFPLRLDVQANTSHPQNDEVDGIVPTLAGWGGKTAARGSGMEDGRAVHPPQILLLLRWECGRQNVWYLGSLRMGTILSILVLPFWRCRREKKESRGTC